MSLHVRRIIVSLYIRAVAYCASTTSCTSKWRALNRLVTSAAAARTISQFGKSLRKKELSPRYRYELLCGFPAHRDQHIHGVCLTLLRLGNKPIKQLQPSLRVWVLAFLAGRNDHVLDLLSRRCHLNVGPWFLDLVFDRETLVEQQT